jgi:hypothetical protein
MNPRRIRVARAIAIAADALQLIFFPAFGGGWVSPLSDVVDVLVALILVALVGWHWAFLPSFIAEIVPGLDLVPTWTAATWFATRRPRSARLTGDREGSGRSDPGASP